MEIKKTLVLSTGHLPHGEFTRLEETSEHLPYRFIKHEYGCILMLSVESIVGDNPSEWDWVKNSPKLKAIVELAIENECRSIEFDEDGKQYECLELFDWENNSKAVDKKFTLFADFIETNRYHYSVSASTKEKALIKLKEFCESEHGNCPYSNMDEYNGIKCFDRESAFSTESFKEVIE